MSRTKVAGVRLRAAARETQSVLFSRRAIAVLLALLATFSVPLASRATQYNPPWIDIFGSKWDNLDTRGSATRFYNELGLSFYTRYLDLNKTAVISMGTAYADSDAVWATFGHGNTGDTTFCNNPGAANCYTYLSASAAVGWGCLSPNACISGQGTEIRDIRLMIYASCYSGLDGAPGTTYDGNLLDYSKTGMGVDSVFGFDGLIYWPPGDDWASYAGAYLQDGEDFRWVMVDAAQSVKNQWFGWGGGYDNWRGLYKTGDSLYPVGYGTP